MRSKKLALSAISAALIALILTLGAYVEITDLFCVLVSSVFVVMPMYYKSYMGCFLTYLAGGVIAFMFSGFNIFSIVFPSYIVFFGLYPLVRCIMADKNVNKWIIMVVGLIWCVATLYGMYFYYTAIMNITFEKLPKWLANNILYILAGLGIIFYFIYDRFVYLTRIFLDKQLARIIK